MEIVYKCRDECGATALVGTADKTDVNAPPGWAYLPIQRAWRCPKCKTLLETANNRSSDDES